VVYKTIKVKDKGDIEIWTTQDTADFLCVSCDYVRNMVRQKLIPHFRLSNNGKILFTKSKVIEWFLSLEIEVEERIDSWSEEDQKRFIDQHLG
jgi:hypothetical protein